MSIEAMKQALEALENAISDDKPYILKSKEAITALREAIEFAEMVAKGTKAWADTPDDWVDDLRGGVEKQKPVAFRNTETGDFCTGGFLRKDWAKWQPLYAAPREWVVLTDEEIIDVLHPLVMADNPDEQTDYEIARAIEAKLKERNS
jgi:hypothetical protein